MVVFSHLILDFVSHVPDMAIYPGSAKVGLGLWRSTEITVVVELAMILLALLSYLRITKAVHFIGTFATWIFIVFLLAAYGLSIMQYEIHDTKVMGWLGCLAIALLGWVHWFDHHRTIRKTANK